MGIAIIILLSLAIILLIVSFFVSNNKAKEEERMEQFSVSFMEEIQGVQNQMRNLELDTEMLAKDAGVNIGSERDRKLRRDLLSLYKRGYSYEGIAKEKRMPQDEVESLLKPYVRSNGEGSKVVNGL
ncbi:hypothetical protein [Alkalihalobacillus trypoxylicola]|uniref:Uncharacterized protein n=1 Tax=Alkalihalobacillus trypoxylicola TaxID=519424 RepID=A0A162EZC8_9BACI|nr:hypothetical protein [Alkalihalobacillus trypoxylicola]KYG34102.1 hypothetical protein AZF04_14830 [Alkalihalobacillus trypoxylicola]GAF63182.1 hypothetical protein BTS2_0073 [Bacillus sp. TS-2]